MKKFSWIVSSTYLYIIFIILYSILGNTDSWYYSFWIISLLICIASLLFNFIKNKTIKEEAYIVFLVISKILNLIYLIVGLILHRLQWMETNIYFIITLIVASFIAFNRYKSWQED